MTSERPRSIVLWGPSGAGKSTVGALLAAKLERPFVDTDALVAARAGAPVGEVFAGQGEAHFRELERSVLLEALAREDAPVIAVGGGALVDEDLRSKAHDHALVVGLSASVEMLVARLGDGAARPLLEGDVTSKLSALLHARAMAYADAAIVVDTDARDPQAIVDEIIPLAEDELVPASASRSSWVWLARDAWAALRSAVARARPTSVIVLTDDTVKALYLDQAVSALDQNRVDVVVIPPGEREKSFTRLEAVLDRFVESDLDRDALLVTLGGGVISDLGGLTASIFMRGVRWVAVPTTTLAMVDAAIGGKTAIDHRVRKNIIGSFHLPLATIVCPTLARTEQPRARTSALAEVIKTFAVRDGDAFSRLTSMTEAELASDAAQAWCVRRAARLKAAVVAEDVHDRGLRRVLNFGHTFGHAIEAAGDFDRFTHGEAISIGMALAARVGVALGVTPAALSARLVSLLDRVGLPTSVDDETLARALPLLVSDKKRSGSAIHFILLSGPGRALVRPIPVAELMSVVKPRQLG